ncbi:MAG: hypothetical protein WAK29_04900 [Terriglobales bacterium]
MNSHNPVLVNLLWCAQPILQLVVASIVWRRDLHKKFPVFFWFLLVQVVNFVVMFPIFLAGNNNWLTGNYSLYFGLYWLGEAINAVLGFKVIHEVFLDVFRPYHTLKDLGTLLFRWAGIVMLLVSVVVAFSNSVDSSPLVHAVTTLQRSVLIVQFGLILFLILFARFLGVSWKQTSFGISLGFGLFAGVELMFMVLRSGRLVSNNILNLVNLGTYIVAILIWMGYSLSRNSVRVTANHLQTQRWEQGLADLQNVVPSDSLIPMFEGMVERAFSRNSNLGVEEGTIPFSRPVPSKASSAAIRSKLRP